jgi:hypothetical protein
MLRLTVAVLAVALASTASAGGWRNLRIDGSSEAGFAESVEAFKEKLPMTRRYAFAHALQDIWEQGVKDAEAAEREYTASEYFRQIDGLGYDEVVTLLDPTGEKAKARYREASRLYARAPSRSLQGSPWPASLTRPAGGWGSTPESVAQGMQQCHCGQPNGPQGN